MKICLAQIAPVKGDVRRNIENHQEWIDRAAAHHADLIVFPELSLTGYEPELARDLATTPDDARFDALQKLSDTLSISIGAGMPLRMENGIGIGMILFRPQQDRSAYLKAYLHPDEEAYFASGNNAAALIYHDPNVAPAICYELSVPEHAEHAFESGAEIYIASVAKSENGVRKASERLAEIAEKYAMTVLMVNGLGPCDNFIAAGQSAAWNKQGKLTISLDDRREGLLIIDTATGGEWKWQ